MLKKGYHIALGFFIYFVLTLSQSFANAPVNFDTAKKIATELFSSHPITLYCGCSYDEDKNIDLESCNMQAAQAIQRAHRVEWEHMMPAEHFGRYHECWTEKLCTDEKNGKQYRGRKCCEKIDPEFRREEAELYNLWPAVGSVNQARSNYNFALLYNKRGFYGCEMEIDKESKLAEPPDRAKGIVARANLFMAERYNVEISKELRKLYSQWNKQFPPTRFEKQWAESVANIVGYENPYITRRS